MLKNGRKFAVSERKNVCPSFLINTKKSYLIWEQLVTSKNTSFFQIGTFLIFTD